MWENPIFKKVWEVGKKSAVLMKKHYKNGLMLGVLLLAMFFLGRSIGAIAYGLRMQREIKTQETAGTALENTEALFSAENWGLGFGAEGTQPTGTASAEKLKSTMPIMWELRRRKRSILLLIVAMRTVIVLLYWMH